MSGDFSQDAADAITALGDDPTPIEVYEATIAYDSDYVVAAAASLAAGGSGGGFDPVTVLLECTGLDLHDEGSHPLQWTGAYNNGYEYTQILTLPAGIGLTVAFDGTDETITTTTAGTWALTLAINVPGDVTWTGNVTAENNLPASARMPLLASVSNVCTVGGPFTYPSGATIQPSIATTTAATADPLTMQYAELLIVRLA